MATKSDVEPADNGKPTRSSSPPVIRRLAVAEEDSKTRLLKRQMPAFVLSGLIHVVLISSFLLYNWLFPDKPTEVAAKVEPTYTKVDEVKEPEPDLTNPDQGLDSELAAAVEVEREADLNVEAPVVENESAGLPSQEKDFATQTSQIGQQTNSFDLAGTTGDIGQGLSAVGNGGQGSGLAMEGLRGRSGATKEKLLRSGGGNDETEAAVGRALVWLAKQQNTSGYWEFDGSHKESKVAATGMAILPFLAAGETHLTGKKYKATVAKGLDYLKSQIKANGQFGQAGMYEQAIATIAICEAAGMTQDDKLKKMARAAIDFIIKAQAGNGSWGYTAGNNGDTSIVGWQIQALKSGKLAGIAGTEKALKQAEAFLISVSDDSESRYGYATKGASHTLSAVGLLSRIYITGNPRIGYVAKGVKHMWEENKPNEGTWEMYYYYYATQVVHFFDGADWHQKWNPAMRKLLLDKQVTQNTANAKPADIGSWPKDTGLIGISCGKLGTTVLACLSLEVYYRHLPLNKREAAGGLAELDGKN